MVSKQSTPNSFWDFWAPLIFTLCFYIGIRQYVIEARYIPSGSMLPGLEIQDRLLIEKISLLRREPLQRGEIVVFNSPYSFDSILGISSKSSFMSCFYLNLPLLGMIPGLANPACDAYIKRVVAVAGDNVLINERGQLTLNGKKKVEPYVTKYCSLGNNGLSLCRSLRGVVPKDHVLVLGDNRSNSWDGRYWPGSGYLPIQEIIGKAVWRFWPINRLGPL